MHRIKSYHRPEQDSKAPRDTPKYLVSVHQQVRAYLVAQVDMDNSSF